MGSKFDHYFFFSKAISTISHIPFIIDSGEI